MQVSEIVTNNYLFIIITENYARDLLIMKLRKTFFKRWQKHFFIRNFVRKIDWMIFEPVRSWSVIYIRILYWK